MHGIEGAYAGARRAFRNPMLALLHKRDAPLVVALLTSVFRPDRRSVAVADVHTEVGDALAHLRAGGYDGVPDRPARAVCRSWVEAGWLVRRVDDDGVEVYELSAYATDALDVSGRAAGVHARVSRSRVRTLLDAVDRLAEDADPDVMTRRARLDREIRERQAELDRLDRTGEIDAVDDEQLLEEAENVLLLVRELPADFARVAESLRAIQRETVTALRRDERPTGAVLRDYLDRSENLMDATPEGRAFAGAQRLLDDPERLAALSTAIAGVLRRPFAARLTPNQRAELAALTRRIDQGFAAVNDAQRQASRVIANQVRNHDPLRDRQVDDLLRDVIAGLGAWLPTTRRGQAVDALTRPPRAAVGKLRFTLDPLTEHAGPESLERFDAGPADDDAVAHAQEHARAWGGPRYAELSAALAAALDDATGQDVLLSEVFAGAEDSLRRPVDLVGLLEVAARESAVETRDAGEVATVRARRPDGATRVLAFADAVVRTVADEHGPAGAAPHGHGITTKERE